MERQWWRSGGGDLAVVMAVLVRHETAWVPVAAKARQPFDFVVASLRALGVSADETYGVEDSHFDGQDLLEAGTGMDVAPGAARDGWLNRLLQAVPGITSETAYAVGREALPILGGPADVRNWAPDQDLVLSAAGRVLLDHVYHDDALFRDNVEEAFALSGSDPAAGGDGDMIVDFAAERLRGDTRIAAFSQSGWDTHKGQARGITKPLEQLQRTILRMKEQLRPEVWGKTVVMAMTEFGRTVRENGSAGTDHGTGGVMLVAGGAVKGDLMPTSDVRAWAAHAMRGLYGLDRGVLEASVFPGLDMGDDPGLLL